MNMTSDVGLARFYQFFETHGNERLDGLDASYFRNLTAREKEEAWNFLKKGIPSSYERIKGLYILDSAQAIQIFKDALDTPIETSPFAREREQLEQSRLLMLSYVIDSKVEKKYLDALTEFAHSEFADVRAVLHSFFQLTPLHHKQNRP